MGLSKELVYIRDYYEKAKSLKATWGQTDLYSTGHSPLDMYLGGGYGRRNGYEIVLLFGATGVGKSTVGLNFLKEPIKAGVNIGLMVLEDDMADVSNRLHKILGDDEYLKMNNNRNVRCIPEDDLSRSWNLRDVIEYIEYWFEEGIDLILLDHLQFLFENAEAIRGENEYINQRIFMQKLNQLVKRSGKTVILVSHQHKDNKSKGMDKIVGSGSIAQAATKVIEVAEDTEMIDHLWITMHKSRFTKKPGFGYSMMLTNGKLYPAGQKNV